MSKSKKNNKRSRKTNISRKMHGGTYDPINKVYNADRSGLTTYPDDIPLETEILRLDKNELTEIPAKIGELVNLRELHLKDNRLTTLPPEIGKLVNLTDLNVPYNELTTLPPEIGNLVSLRILYLSGNKLTTLPREIGNLKNLRAILVGNNQLTELPSEIGYLPNINRLAIYYNNLTTIPVSFINLEPLIALGFHNNPYVWLHPHIRDRFPIKPINVWYDKDKVKIMEKSPEDMKKDMMVNTYNNQGDAVFSSIPPPPPTFALPPDDKLGIPKLTPLDNASKENMDLPKPPPLDNASKENMDLPKPNRSFISKDLEKINEDIARREVKINQYLSKPPPPPNPLNKKPLPHVTSKKKIELPQDIERYMSEFFTPADLARYSQVNKATYNAMRNKNMGGKRRKTRKARKSV